MSAASTGFRDPQRLTWWTRFLLYAFALCSAVAILSDVGQLQLLTAGTFTTEEAEANDLRQRAVSILSIASLIATVIAVAIWTYRANLNARKLGAAAYSPPGLGTSAAIIVPRT